MLATWWTKTNWAVASPYDFEDGDMPPEFTELALKRLLELPLGEPTFFESFADQMIEDTKRKSEYKLAEAKKMLGTEVMDIALSVAREKIQKEITRADDEALFNQFLSNLDSVKGNLQ